ncbi:hypothetical protein LP7551_03886 [Roseibium album]|nr:hypothetical protein LP7551_03886 [Roseibium album]
MKTARFQRILRFVLVTSLLVSVYGTTAVACSLHDPVQLSKGLLNHYYPNSLHVSGAIWAAQRDGILPMPDRKRLTAIGKERQDLDLRALQNAVRAIVSIDEELHPRLTATNLNASIVLVERYLWARFASDRELAVHVDGATKGDLVIVTDEPVVTALVAGRMTFEKAQELGVLKFFGTKNQIASFIDSASGLGAVPMKRANILKTYKFMSLIPKKSPDNSLLLSRRD